MKKVAIVFWSGTGNTEAMANAIEAGVKAEGAACDMIQAADFNSGKVSGYTALAFGCPSMGAEVLEETEMQPMWDDVKSALAGMPVALFGSYGWGSGEWMNNWVEEAEGENANVLQHYICNETPDDDAIAACTALGAALAKA